ncbi:BppU family phage baseplate upper protein [Bacillus mycoides]|uniref:BppU family phage baseplate upper protein n=1 Tax=Bacillus mycoides TaxID=1405 RepID=UPI003D038BD1
MNQAFEITVDIQKRIDDVFIEFSQSNLNTSELIINITDGGKEFPLKDDDKIIVYFKKPDRTVVFQNKDIEILDKVKGKIKVLLTTQTLVRSGDVSGDITIEREVDGKRKRVGTYDFKFKVRASNSSNEVIESTNEFQVFDKIIEAGEKFKGKDIDGIIAAGAKADAALPKTGGTMTGRLSFDVSGDKQGLWFRDGKNSKDVFNFGTTPVLFNAYDLLNATEIFAYDLATKTFKVSAPNTNMLKKTGDTMAGTLNMQGSIGLEGDRNIYHKSADGSFDKGFTFSDANIRLNDWKNNKVIWEYDQGNNKFNVISDTNLLKKTGDTMTGNLDFPVGKAIGVYNIANKRAGYMWCSSTTGKVNFSSDVSGKNFMEYEPSTDTLLLDAKVLKTNKDGRATLTLTADATADDVNFPVKADRRGNTVTLMGKVLLNVGSTGNLVTTLPVDMRPTSRIAVHTVSSDGTPVFIDIQPSGTVSLGTKGKAVYMIVTYVVD